jgi:outer membrane protein
MGKTPLPRVWLRGSVLGGFALLAGPAFAAQPTTLTDVLVDAYCNNPTLQEQRAALRQANEELPAALSVWRPTVTLQGRSGGFRASRNMPPLVAIR